VSLRGGGAPGVPKGLHPDESKNMAAEFYKGYCRNDHLESRERVRVVMMTRKGHQSMMTMTKKGRQFFKGKI